MSDKKAYLLLKDGTKMQGRSIGVSGCCVGEIVFNTSMTGYQEILSDPSYARQIVTLTYPHVGNTGVNALDHESPDRIHAAGLLVRDCPDRASNWRQRGSLPDYLQRHQVVAAADLDTRCLTRRLRNQGACNGVLYSEDFNEQEARCRLSQFPGLLNTELASTVGTEQVYVWQPRDRDLALFGEAAGRQRYKVAAYDFGVKAGILDCLVHLGCRVTVVPAQTTAEEALALKPDGVFLSNGPGDPRPCDYAIRAIRRFVDEKIPLFGICLGHQLLALACGARTIKMRFGHHGANHPVLELDGGRVLITSQNHGFCVDEASLPDCLSVSHRSLFDGSLQGIRHRHAPAFGFQGHPEGHPGPNDANKLFHQFIQIMQNSSYVQTNGS